jgi:hypothetical protein
MYFLMLTVLDPGLPDFPSLVGSHVKRELTCQAALARAVSLSHLLALAQDEWRLEHVDASHNDVRVNAGSDTQTCQRNFND